MVRRKTRAEYDAIDAVNWSTLSEMRKSPAHYLHRRLHRRQEPTWAMILGTAVHTAVLEPDRFPLEYAVYDGPVRRGADWEAFKAAHEGRTILKESEYAHALAIRDAVRGHPVAAGLLAKGTAEPTLTWTDQRSGLRCKGRPDFVGNKVLVDLKTSRDLTLRRFAATVAGYGYHCQLAFYRGGLVESGMTGVTTKIIAAESRPPYDVGVFNVGEDALYAAAEELRELMDAVKACQDSGQWPGRYPAEVELELPAWAFPADDEPGDFGLTFDEEGGL